MAFGIQNQQSATLSEISLFEANAEEVFAQEGLDTALPDSPHGELKTPSKHYTFSYQSKTCSTKESHIFSSKTSAKFARLENPIDLSAKMASKSYHTAQPQLKGEAKSETVLSHLSQPQKSSEAKFEKGITQKSEPFSQTSTSSTASQKAALPLPTKEQGEVAKQQVKLPSDARKPAERQEKNHHPSLLVSRGWRSQESQEWWQQRCEARYHQRERQGDQKGHDQGQHQEEKEEKLRVAKNANVAANNGDSRTQQNTQSNKIKKPELKRPKLGIFALYYILTKIGIWSDSTSNFSYKKEVELIDFEMTETYKKRLDEIREGVKKERENVRWQIAMTVFSWIGSITAIVAGITMLASGVGAVAGAMLVVGGLIQIGSQLLEITGTWRKIADILPGEDSEKKRAVINWMQIGIAVLCLALSGFGAIWGGFSNLQEAMSLAMSAIGGVVATAHGAATIGEGISKFMHKNKLADIKKYDIKLTRLKHTRHDLMEKMDWGVDRLSQLFEDLARALEFEIELFQADQMVNRR